MGQPSPTVVLGALDSTYLQMGALLEEVGKELAERPWRVMRQRGTFTAPGTELLGTTAQVFGADFKELVPGTFWNDTIKRPIFGPLGDPSWQYFKSLSVSGPTYQYRVEGGSVYATPTIPAGHSLAFVKQRKWWVLDSTGAAYDEYFRADADSPVFEDELMLLGFKWRWKYEKGLPYQEDMNSFELMTAERLARQAENPTVSMNGPVNEISPGVWVSAGNWPL